MYGLGIAQTLRYYGCVFLSPTAIVMFTVAILQRAAVKPPSIIAHEKGFQIKLIYRLTTP